MGGRLIQTVSNHQKTITSLCFDSQRTRLFTGSLDQHVKVYDVQDYKVIYNFKHPAPVLTVACSVSIMYQLGGSSRLTGVKSKWISITYQYIFVDIER